jgi:hypothetical protein
MVNEQGIANGTVDDAVENVSQKFTLVDVSYGTKFVNGRKDVSNLPQGFHSS